MNLNLVVMPHSLVIFSILFARDIILVSNAHLIIIAIFFLPLLLQLTFRTARITFHSLVSEMNNSVHFGNVFSFNNNSISDRAQ